MSLSHKRTGFTFLELLVFLAILAMLFGLLLPAVAKMREREGRTQKFNNLKQVALATHLYHDVNKVLPPATNNVGLFANYPGQATLSMHLLPYVEQQPLANQIQIGGKSLAVLIPAYQITDDPSTTDFISVQNIAGNVRVFTDGGLTTVWNKPVALKSPMPCNATLGRSFPDGTSNTIMYATRYASSGVVSTEGKSPTPCGYYDLPLANNGGSFFGATPMTGNVSATSPSGWQLAPTLAQVNCAFAVGMAHAFDPSGLMVCLVDGSARTISPNISTRTWNLALQPNDGMILGPDWD